MIVCFFFEIVIGIEQKVCWIYQLVCCDSYVVGKCEDWFWCLVDFKYKWVYIWVVEVYDCEYK